MLTILAEETYMEQNYSISICIIKLDRSFLILITDQQNYGLDQVVMGTPLVSEGARAISAPGLLFGFEKNPLSRTISEICSSKLKRPCLVLYHINGLERKEMFVSKTIIKSLKKILETIVKN